MKKIWKMLALFFCCIFITACSVKKTDTEKIRDIEFTVLNKEEIPKELKEEIEKEKKGQMKLSYADQGYLYVVRGYGTKKTTGYSVKVSQCYETKNAVCMKTILLGPEKGEQIIKKKTFPYVVIKMEYTDKHMIYQ